MTLVSVVIPTYNCAPLLRAALQSLIAQTYTDWDAVVVDNHSEDDTLQVIAALNDPRIRVVRIHNHGVIAASRNLGIRESQGEWVAFLDSDDLWYPRRLERIVPLMNDDYDVISTDEVMVNVQTGDRQLLKYGPYEENFYEILLIEGNRLSTSATVVRRTFLEQVPGPFNESREFVTAEDYGLWLDLARLGGRFRFIPEVHGEYTIHGANNSASLERHWANAEALLRSHVFQVQQFDTSPERLWRRVAIRPQLWRVRHALEQRDFGRAAALGLGTLGREPGAVLNYLMSRVRVRLSRRVL